MLGFEDASFRDLHGLSKYIGNFSAGGYRVALDRVDVLPREQVGAQVSGLRHLSLFLARKFLISELLLASIIDFVAQIF